VSDPASVPVRAAIDPPPTETHLIEEMERIPTSKARKDFADVMKRAARQGKRVKITLYGKTLAGLVSAKDLQLLEECEDNQERPKRAAKR
jgi:prevent-host-death family protein